MKSILKVALFVLIGVFCSGTLQAQVVIYDNLTADGGNTNFGGGTGFPASRRMIGDDINTLPLNDPDEFYSVDTVDFPLRFASTAEISPGVIVDFTEFTDVEVTVTFWENVVTATNADGTANGNATAANFSLATAFGSRTFNLGTFTIPAGANQAQIVSLDFTNNGGGIDIGDGQDLGVTFEFRGDANAGAGQPTTMDVQEFGLISIPFRNGGSDLLNEPTIGSTSFINFRDENLNGIIDGNDAVSFAFDQRTRFSISAFVESSVLLGDCNLDGTVNFADIGPFINILSGAAAFLTQADCNEDGIVDFSDIQVFIQILLES